jgi:hypothetical protein
MSEESVLKRSLRELKGESLEATESEDVRDVDLVNARD